LSCHCLLLGLFALGTAITGETAISMALHGAFGAHEAARRNNLIPVNQGFGGLEQGQAEAARVDRCEGLSRLVRAEEDNAVGLRFIAAALTENASY
jgi:hypothetical protein